MDKTETETERVCLGEGEEDRVLWIERATDKLPPTPDHLAQCGRDVPVEMVERVIAARAVWVAAQNEIRAHVGLGEIGDGWFG